MNQNNEKYKEIDVGGNSQSERQHNNFSIDDSRPTLYSASSPPASSLESTPTLAKGEKTKGYTDSLMFITAGGILGSVLALLAEISSTVGFMSVFLFPIFIFLFAFLPFSIITTLLLLYRAKTVKAKIVWLTIELLLVATTVFLVI